jgi:hypothetical protein
VTEWRRYSIWRYSIWRYSSRVQWPHDDATDRGIGTLEDFHPNTKSAAAHCDRAYRGIRLRRKVQLSGGVVVDSADPDQVLARAA